MQSGEVVGGEASDPPRAVQSTTRIPPSCPQREYRSHSSKASGETGWEDSQSLRFHCSPGRGVLGPAGQKSIQSSSDYCYKGTSFSVSCRSRLASDYE